ncbi:MAG: hypothetical protein LBC13_01930, partial [Clostridiales bacterium]|nr:hypothetical protein [Clostridiales bacterium]
PRRLLYALWSCQYEKRPFSRAAFNPRQFFDYAIGAKLCISIQPLTPKNSNYARFERESLPNERNSQYSNRFHSA